MDAAGGRTRCGSEAAGEFAPPPLPSPSGKARIRPSKVGKWRALTLVLVHVLVAVHVVHWMRTGSTLSPLEPSESGDYMRDGIVRAGLIFFALTVVSTLFLGRWFCGWACHVVALQDGSRWLLGRLGLTPRPVRLGLLAWVPWIAVLHMFYSPLVDRWLAGHGIGVRSVELTTQAFWGTFPGLSVALATFFVCGFAIVWLLGAKGFCTYACPYGGLFGIVDQLAPARIRVTDACDACGHCTAVCSSNVLVSQEVRDYGAVVDPGCMKCMDCVSVCPQDALYFGWGKPAIATRARRALSSHPFFSARRLLEVAFVLSTFTLLETYHGLSGVYLDRPRLLQVLIVAIPALLIGWLFRGKSRRAVQISLWEEALLGVLFLFSLFLFRGHDWVPFLFALGLSAVGAYLAFEGLGLYYRRNLSLQRVRLKVEGRVQKSGFAFASVLVVLAGGSAWLGYDQVERTLHARDNQRQQATHKRDLRKQATELHREGLRAIQEGRLEDAIGCFRTLLQVDAESLPARKNLAAALCAAGHFEEGRDECERILKRTPEDAASHELAWRACARLGDAAGARAHLEAAVRLLPERSDLARALSAAPGSVPLSR